MATTAVERVGARRMTGIPDEPRLADIRRLEALAFRAWPSRSTYFDGTWSIRLTPDHPAKRLNSVNPLDPFDIADFERRIGEASALFHAHGLDPVFRLTPLSPPSLADTLAEQGWETFDASLVQRLDLDGEEIDAAIDQIPLKDVERFVAASLFVHERDPSLGGAYAGVVGSIVAESGLFVHEEDGEPVSTAICVHDGDTAGLLEIATVRESRGRGYGRRIVLSALKWARLRGARQAWLQVGADNSAALSLYSALGFRTAYAYRYMRLASNG